MALLLAAACGAPEDGPLVPHGDEPDPLHWPDTQWAGWLIEPQEFSITCDGEERTWTQMRSTLGKVFSTNVDGRNYLYFGNAAIPAFGGWLFYEIRCPILRDGTFSCPVQYAMDPMLASDVEHIAHRVSAWELSGQYLPVPQHLRLRLVMTQTCTGERCQVRVCERIEAGVATPWRPR